MLIHAKEIFITRNHKTLLKDVSIKINKGDFISLIGPNGAGKTTLLKILLGIEKPEGGIVIRAPQLKMGYMPQKFVIEPLFPLTSRRFLELTHHPNKTTLKSIIEEMRIETILEKPLKSLSGGELQRVLLARALLRNPDILMLDEPVQNLDIHGQMHFYELLEKLYTTRGLTIIMVSHDLHMVMRATRKVICLFHHICCEGAPETVRQHPRFIELFGQDISRMLKVYQHSHTHSHDNHEEGLV